MRKRINIDDNNVHVGDIVVRPVHMERGVEMMTGTVTKLYEHFYRVLFKPNKRFEFYESYAYIGLLG